jgi:hypothetical protein
VIFGATILSVAPVGSSRDTAFTAEQHDEVSVSVGFGFLNPGDYGLLEVLYECEPDESPTVTFNTRVIGARPTDIRLFSGSLRPAESIAAFALPVACVLATYLSAKYIRSSIQPIPNGFTISWSAAALTLLLFTGFVVSGFVLWRYTRRVHESRLPTLAKKFLTG